MSSNFERLQKIINKVYAKNLAIYFMWKTEIYQNPPVCGQDELYLPAMLAQPKKNEMKKSLLKHQIKNLFPKDVYVLNSPMQSPTT